MLSKGNGTTQAIKRCLTCKKVWHKHNACIRWIWECFVDMYAKCDDLDELPSHDLASWNWIWYAKCGQVGKSQKVLKGLPDWDVASWNA